MPLPLDPVVALVRESPACASENVFCPALSRTPYRIFRVTLPPPRPPEIAEKEEFDAACAAGTAQALELFIERHPESRWRPEAERRLRTLPSTPR